ncbi:hypothetical protein O0I10_003221 [Lichtheimia ornata]|uniref:Uncharacterized protein n=1 Tax=Lichtheimia ornata TaxID=688661 RepID=A0AAD7V7Q8_9FUNG|nr:uncharacterized protein O0I10_003221 [Lichtheimia ornata]KAJ8660999.1 hypothetical protein O0I10_003221 [Lichtheimia ornata]
MERPNHSNSNHYGLFICDGEIYPDDANAATVLSSGIAAIDHDAFGYEDGGFGLFTWRRSRHFSASCFIGMPRYKQRYQDCA